jgi:hypothetical protein
VGRERKEWERGEGLGVEGWIPGRRESMGREEKDGGGDGHGGGRRGRMGREEDWGRGERREVGEGSVEG